MSLREKYSAVETEFDLVRDQLRVLLKQVGLEDVRAYSWCHVDAAGGLHIRGWDGETLPSPLPCTPLIAAGFDRGVWLDSRTLLKRRVYLDGAGSIAPHPKESEGA